MLPRKLPTLQPADEPEIDSPRMARQVMVQMAAEGHDLETIMAALNRRGGGIFANRTEIESAVRDASHAHSFRKARPMATVCRVLGYTAAAAGLIALFFGISTAYAMRAVAIGLALAILGPYGTGTD